MDYRKTFPKVLNTNCFDLLAFCQVGLHLTETCASFLYVNPWMWGLAQWLMFCQIGFYGDDRGMFVFLFCLKKPGKLMTCRMAQDDIETSLEADNGNVMQHTRRQIWWNWTTGWSHANWSLKRYWLLKIFSAVHSCWMSIQVSISWGGKDSTLIWLTDIIC